MFETLPQIDPHTLARLSTLLSLGSTVLGLAVAYIAFRGYRHGSRPMLFVAVGFALVFWVPFLLFVGHLLVPRTAEFVLGVAGEVSQFVGLLCILYGLWVPDRR